MAKNLIQEITSIAAPIAADEGLVVAGVRINTEKGIVVQVLLEDEEGNSPSIESCAYVSREMAHILDVEDTIAEKYTLEVSSPGLNRPLFSMKDVARFIGKNAKVKCVSDVADKRTHTGKITAVTDDAFTLMPESTAPVTLNWADVREAKLSPTDDEIKALLKQSKSNKTEGEE